MLRYWLAVVTTKPHVWFQPRQVRPCYDGGCDWFGVRLWPMWLEFHWRRT